MTIRTALMPMSGGTPCPYEPSQILFESGVPGTYSFEVLVEAIYDIWLVAGGGGSSSAAGGTGATLHLRAKLLPGIYNVTVGMHGAGAGAYVRNNNGAPGGASLITGASCTILANGGTQGYGRRNGGAPGKVGTHSIQALNFEILFQSPAGTAYSLSYITGTSSGYGAGGIAQGNETGSGYNGWPGYVKISFETLK